MRTEIDVPNQGLGLEARWDGVSSFSLLVEEFKKKRAQEPGFYAFLNDLVKGANNKGVLVKSAVNREPNASEIILGEWVLLAAEKAYLEFLAEKNNGLNASQGARYLQLDEAAQRKEDLLRLLHEGDRKVTVAGKVVGIKADALGDVVTRIQEWWENCSAVRKGAYAVAGIGAVLAGCVSTPYMPPTEVFVPETQPRTAEVTELPQPGVTIVTESPQPTVTQNFGLNGQEEEEVLAAPQETEKPTQQVEMSAQEVAVYLGYSDKDCKNCIIQEVVPEIPGTRRELWNDEIGIMTFWTKETGWVSTKGWAAIISNGIVNAEKGFEGGTIQKSAGSPEYFFQGFLDGTYTEEPFHLLDSTGNIILTNRLAFPFFLCRRSRSIEFSFGTSIS